MTIAELMALTEDVDVDLPVYIFVDGRWQEAEVAYEEVIEFEAEPKVREVFCIRVRQNE